LLKTSKPDQRKVDRSYIPIALVVGAILALGAIAIIGM
jgi:hypothetical protein